MNDVWKLELPIVKMAYQLARTLIFDLMQMVTVSLCVCSSFLLSLGPWDL